jgi:hypothetical protein
VALGFECLVNGSDFKRLAGRAEPPLVTLTTSSSTLYFLGPILTDF